MERKGDIKKNSNKNEPNGPEWPKLMEYEDAK